MKKVETIVESILKMRSEVPVERSLLTGISGIDASGKGYIAALVQDELRRRSIITALINVDGWLNLPDVRFGGDDHGTHFYDQALRLDDMFERIILPLRRDRAIRVTADLTEETAANYHEFEYRFENVDVILLEGIFLFKKQFIAHFDLKIWIQCSFETALQRAISRSQEGLGPEQTINAYETIYFPAQRVHLAADRPRSMADIILDNDQ